MIKIYFFLDKDQSIRAVKITGHAGFADAGMDIVCAAVSTQVISVENSIDRLLGVAVDAKINENQGGYLELTFPDNLQGRLKEDVQLLLRHLYLSYQVLQKTYPKYIQLKQDTYPI